jgi:hypothetical protein
MTLLNRIPYYRWNEPKLECTCHKLNNPVRVLRELNPIFWDGKLYNLVDFTDASEERDASIIRTKSEWQLLFDLKLEEKHSSLTSNLTEFNSVHNFTNPSLQIYFNIILVHIFRFLKFSLTCRFSHKCLLRNSHIPHTWMSFLSQLAFRVNVVLDIFAVRIHTVSLSWWRNTSRTTQNFSICTQYSNAIICCILNT